MKREPWPLWCYPSAVQKNQTIDRLIRKTDRIISLNISVVLKTDRTFQLCVVLGVTSRPDVLKRLHRNFGIFRIKNVYLKHSPICRKKIDDYDFQPKTRVLPIDSRHRGSFRTVRSSRNNVGQVNESCVIGEKSRTL